MTDLSRHTWTSTPVVVGGFQLIVQALSKLPKRGVTRYGSDYEIQALRDPLVLVPAPGIIQERLKHLAAPIGVFFELGDLNPLKPRGLYLLEPDMGLRQSLPCIRRGPVDVRARGALGKAGVRAGCSLGGLPAAPDIPAPINSTAFFQRRDPALEAILAYASPGRTVSS